MAFFSTNDQDPTKVVAAGDFLATEAAKRRYNRGFDAQAIYGNPFPADHRYQPTTQEASKYAKVTFQETALGQIWLNNNRNGPKVSLAAGN
jgi:hypothetical protein